MKQQYYRDDVQDIEQSDEEIILRNYDELNGENIPDNIINIRIMKKPYHDITLNYLNNLPYSLNNINFENMYAFLNNIDNLPYNVKTLKLYFNNFNHIINNLPLSLFNLVVFYNPLFNKNIKLPPNLRLLWTNINLNKLISFPNISHLKYLGQHEINNLPNTVKELCIYNTLNKYNKHLDFLPEGLEILKLSDINVPVNDLPSSIKEIWIKGEYKYLINKMYHHKIKTF